MKDLLRVHATEFYDEEICKLVKPCDKCLNLNGDLVGTVLVRLVFWRYSLEFYMRSEPIPRCEEFQFL